MKAPRLAKTYPGSLKNWQSCFLFSLDSHKLYRMHTCTHASLVIGRTENYMDVFSEEREKVFLYLWD